LWLQGKPGSGKSTLVKQIQKRLSAKEVFDPSKPALLWSSTHIQSAYTPVIAHFFYSIRGGNEGKSHAKMLRSLLYQILKQEARFYPAYRTVFRDIRNSSEGAIDWSYANLRSVFASLAELRLRKDTDMFSRDILLIIDAMDESEAGIHQTDVLSLIHKLCSHSPNAIQAIVSSRPAPKITSSFRHCRTITLQDENGSDIKKIIEHSLDIISSLVRDDGYESDGTTSVASYSSSMESTNLSIYAEIRDYLMEHSQGVILWIVLILRELEAFAGNDGVTPWKVREKLKSLPDDLENLYSEIVERLKAQESSDVNQGRLMLNWATFVRRPLTLEEFRDALAVTMAPNIPPFYSNETLLKDHRVISWDSLQCSINNQCGGLLEVQRLNPSKTTNGPRDITQLIHQTVREFLTRPDSSASPYNVEKQSGNSIISSCCVRYLMLSLPMGKGDRYSAGIDTWVAKDYDRFIQLLNDRPLLLYALSFLPEHMRNLTDSRETEDLAKFIEARSQEHNSFAWYFLSQWIKSLPFHLEHQSNTGSKSSMMADFRATCLIFAAKRGYTSVAKSLIEAGASVDRISGISELRNLSALDAAARFSRAEVLEVMITHTTWPLKGISTLKEAASKDNIEFLTLLLAAGATADARDSDNLSTLHVAAAYGATNAARALVNAGADVEARDSLEAGGLTPLHWAAIWGSREMVATLLDLGANIQVGDKRGRTPLHWATNFCRCGVISGRPGGREYYIPSTMGVNWSTQYHCAQHQQEIISMAKFLIDSGAMINAKDSDGGTPLHHLAFRKVQDSKIASFLVREGAYLDARDNSGFTPIHRAAEAGNLEIMSTLLEELSHNSREDATPSKAQTNKQVLSPNILTISQRLHFEDEKGQKPIHIAAAAGQIAIVAKILDLLPNDLEILDTHGESALYKAVLAQNPEMIRFLLSRKARKPLIHSFLQHDDFFDILKLLVLEGWDVDQLDEEEETALYIAFQVDPGRAVDKGSNNNRQGPRTLEAFLAVGADPNITSLRGRSILHEAAKSGSDLWVRKLIEVGVDVNIRDDCGRTPLHDAAESAQESIVKILLKNGADPALRDVWDQTAIQDSLRCGHRSICRTLLRGQVCDDHALERLRYYDLLMEATDVTTYGKQALLKIQAQKQQVELQSFGKDRGIGSGWSACPTKRKFYQMTL
jgi:ankyrin repeat protein